ncbi:hypothetical protein CKAN_00320200 [Cinnamomum micranthum f. kanehirae]|uniref:Uncharacterized protein n=1 Tax=Cinnamomum micranthum f. kanehirae TaxID=337451 RepID=A0A443N8K1_9MAGN|nr:hypothetical protein CKAN_00320200 [Cinnamomum micranthum f. kanehirae]
MQHVTSLQYLYVASCPQLASLPQGMQLLNLQHLSIWLVSTCFCGKLSMQYGSITFVLIGAFWWASLRHVTEAQDSLMVLPKSLNFGTSLPSDTIDFTIDFGLMGWSSSSGHIFFPVAQRMDGHLFCWTVSEVQNLRHTALEMLGAR